MIGDKVPIVKEKVVKKMKQDAIDILKNRFLGQFENNIRTNIIEFGKKMTNTKADVYILMARKAVCFIDCLQSLSMINLDGYVTTERILDMDTTWLKNKDVIIIDDTIVSGTTIRRTIDNLNRIGVSSIKVHVLSINKRWFSPALLEGKNGISYLQTPYLTLEDEECIKECLDIVRALSIIPRPYDIDFPYFPNVKITPQKIEEILCFPEWESDEISSQLQLKNGIFAITLTPNEIAKAYFNTLIGFKISDHSILKIRLYGRNIFNNKESMVLRIVPIAILKPINENEINSLFDTIIDHSEMEKSFFYEYFCTTISKLRFIQYIIAARFALFWSDSFMEIFVNQPLLKCELKEVQFLFSPTISKEVVYLASMKFKLNVNNEILGHKVLYSEPIAELKFKNSDLDLISLQTRLTEPFLRLFWEREIPARELVKQYGIKAFERDDYKLLDRLNSGYNFDTLLDLLHDAHDKFCTSKLLSLYLDKAIDAGVAVPIYTELNGIYYRAFRHGEDVQFGEEEEKLCYILLDSFISISGIDMIPHFWIEKLLVLLLQIGTQNGFLNQFNSNVPQKCSVASVKYYLHGPVVVENYIESRDELGPPYLRDDKTSTWIHHILTNKGIIKKEYITKGEKQVVRYKLGEKPKVILDEKKETEADDIGVVFGTLINNHIEKKAPCINPAKDFVILTACIDPPKIASALSAELNLFNMHWYNFLKLYSQNFNNRKEYFRLAISIREKNSMYFTAINSGYGKFISFIDQKANKLIEKVTEEFSQKDRGLRNSWKRFWSPNRLWEKDSIDEDLWNNILDLGLWLLCINVYVRIADFCLRKLADIDSDEEKLNNSEFIGTLNKELISYLSKMKEFSHNYRLNNILPYTENFLSRHVNSNESELQKSLQYALEKIEKLIYSSKKILENTELIVGPIGEPLKIRKYPHALFVEFDCASSEKENTLIIIHQLIEDFTQKIINADETKSQENRLYLLPEHKNYLEKGHWILCSGNKYSPWLINFAVELCLRRANHFRVRAVLFGQLHNDCCFKVAGKTRSDIKAGHFWEKVNELKDRFTTNRIFTNEILIIQNDDKDLIPEYRKIWKFNAKKQYFRPLESDILKIEKPIKERYKIDKLVMRRGALEEINMDIGIITVKPCETRAVIKHMLYKDKVPGRKTARVYHVGCFEGKDGIMHRVSLLQQLHQGNRPVITAYNDMVKDYDPRLMILLGIGGSIQKNNCLCDVVICNQTIYYENNKEYPNKKDRRGDTYKIPPKILVYINEFFINHGEFPKLDSAPNSFEDKFNVFLGPIGAGETIIADKLSNIKVWLKEFNDKTFSIETEAGGFSHAYYEEELSYIMRRIGNLIIRGTSDHADLEKNDKWREPAAENAVITLKEILKLMPSLESIANPPSD